MVVQHKPKNKSGKETLGVALDPSSLRRYYYDVNGGKKDFSFPWVGALTNEGFEKAMDLAARKYIRPSDNELTKLAENLQRNEDEIFEVNRNYYIDAYGEKSKNYTKFTMCKKRFGEIIECLCVTPTNAAHKLQWHPRVSDYFRPNEGFTDEAYQSEEDTSDSEEEHHGKKYRTARQKAIQPVYQSLNELYRKSYPGIIEGLAGKFEYVHQNKRVLLEEVPNLYFLKSYLYTSAKIVENNWQNFTEFS